MGLSTREKKKIERKNPVNFKEVPMLTRKVCKSSLIFSLLLRKGNIFGVILSKEHQVHDLPEFSVEVRSSEKIVNHVSGVGLKLLSVVSDDFSDNYLLPDCDTTVARPMEGRQKVSINYKYSL